MFVKAGAHTINIHRIEYITDRERGVQIVFGSGKSVDLNDADGRAFIAQIRSLKHELKIFEKKNGVAA
jgi:hypothetical protein